MSGAKEAVSRAFLAASCIDLDATLDGGQAFGWWAECGGYRGVVGGRLLRLSRGEGGVEVEALDGEDASPSLPLLRDYLGLDDDLKALRERYADDCVLMRAMRDWPGLRLLRQDPWECLVGYICSANSNIGKIKANVAAMAGAYGKRVGCGERDCAFPPPSRLAGASVEALRELGLGFHARYVVPAAEAVAGGSLVLEDVRSLPYLYARAMLMTLSGVAEKVADCVLAFSLGKGEAFPVDIWVRRAVREWYDLLPTMSDGAVGEWARERFGQDAACVNQYLFHARRAAGQAGRSGAGRRDP